LQAIWRFFFSKAYEIGILQKNLVATPAKLTPKCNFRGFDLVLFCALSLSHRPEQKPKYGGMNMIQKLSTKLQVHLSVPGVEKLKKVTFSNVVENPEEAEIIQLGEIMTELDQDGTLLDGVIITSQSRVTK
jgi:hypothetical protein